MKKVYRVVRGIAGPYPLSVVEEVRDIAGRFINSEAVWSGSDLAEANAEAERRQRESDGAEVERLKTASLNIRIAPEDKARLEQLAAADRRSQSDMISWLVDREIERRQGEQP